MFQSVTIVPINESLLSERFSTLRTYFDLLAPSTKRAFSLSRLPLTRELLSVSEAEGEKDYPSVAYGASSPDKGSQERGEN